MGNPKRNCALIVTALVSLLTLSAFLMFSNSANSAVNASNASTNVNAVTESGDLLQYEWPQIHGDPAFTRFSTGPAPEAPEILWKRTINSIQSFVTAFNGKVFVTTTTNVIALDKDTGSTIWNITLPARQRWPTIYKIDSNHLVIGKYCLNVETGEVLWTSDKFSSNTGNFAEGVYSSEEKLFYTKGNSTVQAWNFSDPSKPPKKVWETYVPDSGSIGAGIQYGNGKVFPGSYAPEQMALNAKTGEVIWNTKTTGAMMWSGSYYQGRFLRGGMDNQFYAFNATTGKVLWVYNPNTEMGHWTSGSAAAYGKVYELNKDGHLYAIDVNTGELAWKYKGPNYLFLPGWPVIADGKVYTTTGQANSTDPFTGEYGKSEFACLDAYTGRLLWKLPIEAYAPRESTAIAYGNLYLIPASIGYQEMDSYTVLNEVWAIGPKQWPMFRGDPAHTATRDSGPTNIKLRWKFATNGAVISSPTVVNRRVYVGSYDRTVYCLDALNGRLIWNFTTGAPIKSSPCVDDGKVYIGPDDGYVYCLDAENGNFVWNRYAGGYIQASFHAVARISSSPTVVGGRLYVGSLDTNLYCLDANFGNVLWTYKTSGYITSSPSVVDGAVYFTSQEPTSGALYKLNATTSSLIWKLQIPYRLSEERGTDMMASPTVADGMVFVSSNKLWRYGINTTTGKILWTYTNIAAEFIVDSMSYHMGKLFLMDLNYVACVDAKSGRSIWMSYLGEVLESSPTYAAGKVFVSTSDRREIYVLNATTGERLSWFPTGSKCWSSPTLYEGRLYVGNHDWNVYCLVDATFPIISTSIVANMSKDTINKTKAESVTITGRIKPGIANASIAMTFVKPSGATVDLVVTANEEGAFSASYKPETVGNWTITARYSGAEYPSRAYTPTHSAELHLQVIEAQQPKPQPSTDKGIPMGYVYAGVAVAVIVIVVAARYFLMKERKK